MNKKVIGIIVALLIIVLIVVLCFFIKKNNNESNEINTSSYNNEFKIKGYTIATNAKKEDSTSEGSYFSTSFDIVNNDKTISTYHVNFFDIKLFSEYEEEGITYDIAKPEEVTINGKNFEYYLDESLWNAELYYRIPDGKGQLFIEVRGGSVFTSEGDQLKTLAIIDRSVLESAELADVLNFYIK